MPQGLSFGSGLQRTHCSSGPVWRLPVTLHGTQTDRTPEETEGFTLPKLVAVILLEEVNPLTEIQRPYCPRGRPINPVEETREQGQGSERRLFCKGTKASSCHYRTGHGPAVEGEK